MNFTFRTKSDSFVFNTSGNMMLKFQMKTHDWYFNVSKIYDRNLHSVSIYRGENTNFMIDFAIGKLKITIGRAKRPESKKEVVSRKSVNLADCNFAKIDGMGSRKSFKPKKDSHSQNSKVNNN